MHEERKGPPDYPHWRKCWNVFQAGMIYAAACLPTWLERYADMIMEYNGMYTDSYGYNRIWAFLYQCDNRYRHEHMPRMLRSAILKLERLIERSPDGQATLVHVLDDGREVEFDPASPYEYLWSLPESTWWYKEFELKAQYIAMKLANPDQWVQGTDSMIARTPNERAPPVSHALEGVGAVSYNTSKPLAIKDGKTKGKADGGKAEATGKGGKPKGGKAEDKFKGLRNVKGNRCTAYNQGNCRAAKFGLVCPNDKTKLHTCFACAGEHPVSACWVGSNGGGTASKKAKKSGGWEY